jgi:cellulose synthase/poly-beta-1,6-N-acetylglucosamine synthase-like glycosyltransferase
VVPAPRGRGAQLRAGVAAACGEWLLVLHADARLTPEALAEAERALADPRVGHAAWPLSIEGEGARLRWVERGAALRWRLFGLAYGDQGLLVRRTRYDAAGGYPETRIMEDVVLVRRLNRLGPMRRFQHPIVADGRRWRREGVLRTSLRNFILLLLFLGGASADRLARWYAPEPGAR